jgi:23S rRNA (guanosine2251-2'-O)-methyltransferase
MNGTAAVLVNVRSVHNVGSMFRTADAAGIATMYLCGITPTPLDRLGNFRRDLAKVALGAERSVPWEHVRAAVPLLRKLKREGYRIFAVEQSPRAVLYFKLKAGRKQKLALILGNEVRGLPPAVLRAADAIIEIPMRGKKESLNVAVAFGIVAYHFLHRGGGV